MGGLPTTAGDLASATRKGPYSFCLCARSHSALMDPSHRRAIIIKTICFCAERNLSVSGSSPSWITSGASWNLLHEAVSKRIPLVSQVRCRHSLEGRWLSSPCISPQTATNYTRGNGPSSPGRQFTLISFMVVDAYFKWLEVIPMTYKTIRITTEVLHSSFAHNGLPRKLPSTMGISLLQKSLPSSWN